MKQCKRVFTLIELLIVICVIAIMAAILLPSLQNAGGSASKAHCIDNLKRISSAVVMYTSGFNDYIPALTSPQKSDGVCGWENALFGTIGQNGDSLRKNFFCEADASVAKPGADKKSYSLNNLKEAIHPRAPFSLDAKGREIAGNEDGRICGNKSTSVYTPSSLIVIGENVSPSNTFGNANFSSTNIDSPGSAGAVHQQIAIYKRLTTHTTAGNAYLDGHVTHMNPQQTMPTENGFFHISNKTAYCDSNPSGGVTEGFGDWSDCPKRKRGNASCPGDSTCHKK